MIAVPCLVFAGTVAEPLARLLWLGLLGLALLALVHSRQPKED